MTLLLLEESVHPLQAHIYVLRSSKGIGHTGWGEQTGFCGVLASAEGSKIKGKRENARWEVEQ